MSKALKTSLMLGALAMMPAMVRAADININVAGAYFWKNGTANFADTSNRLPAGLTVLLVCDTENNGLNMSITDPTSSWVADPTKDMILDKWYGGSTAGRFSAHSVQFNLGGGVDVGDDLFLIWFDTRNATAYAGNGPGHDVAFGTYRATSTSSMNGSDTTWDVPQGGFAGTLNMFTVSRATALGMTDGLEESVGVASQKTASAVPEPASLAMLMVGGSLLALRRRRA